MKVDMFHKYNLTNLHITTYQFLSNNRSRAGQITNCISDDLLKQITSA